MTRSRFEVGKRLDRFYSGLVTLLTRRQSPPHLPLYPLEGQLLAEVIDGLPPTLATLLREQLESYNLALRDGQLQKTVFHRIRLGRERFPDRLRFPLRTLDARFASLTFRVGQEKPIHAGVWVHDGRLFMITFDRSVRGLLDFEDVIVTKRKVDSSLLAGVGR